MCQGWARSGVGQTEGGFSWEAGFSVEMQRETLLLLMVRPVCRGLRESVLGRLSDYSREGFCFATVLLLILSFLGLQRFNIITSPK